MNYTQLEKSFFKSFLLFSIVVLLFVNIFFTLNSSKYRINQIIIQSNGYLTNNLVIPNSIYKTSIWLVSENNFQELVLSEPSIEKVNIKKNYPNSLYVEIIEVSSLVNILDLRGSTPKTKVLLKNLIEIDSGIALPISNLTITNGPLPRGFNGEIVSMIETLKSYYFSMEEFSFTYDGDNLIGFYRGSNIYFGKAVDLGTKASALGSLLGNQACTGDFRFITSEDIISNCEY